MAEQAGAAPGKPLTGPDGDSIRALLKLMNTCGLSSRLTPPTMAMSHSRRRSAWQARCSATSDDEHAVSTAMLGPRAAKGRIGRRSLSLLAPRLV